MTNTFMDRRKNEDQNRLQNAGRFRNTVLDSKTYALLNVSEDTLQWNVNEE